MTKLQFEIPINMKFDKDKSLINTSEKEGNK